MTFYLTSIDTFSLFRTVPEIFDFKVFRVRPCFSTLDGHVRSKIFSPFESPYMTSYLTSIESFSLSRTVPEIFDFEVFRVRPCFSTLKGHVRSKILIAIFESSYITSYLTSIETFSLSRTVSEIFDFKVFGVRPCFSTLKDYVRSKMFSPFESPYITSYLTSIETFSLSRTVSEIFDFEVLRVRPWPLTLNLALSSHVRSKDWLLFESPYMTFYLTSIDTCSLFRTVPEIFDFKVFRVRPCFSTLDGHVRSKIYSPFESPYMNSYLTSIESFSLSRTVPEIFDFEVLRVRPGFSTLKGHVRSKNLIFFESSYMTSYLTSIETFSLSRTVSEIFDFKVFRVGPCFSTLKDYVRSKMFSPFESPYITSYLTSIETFSLSRTVSEIFDFKVFRVRPCFSTLKDHIRSKILMLFESPYTTSYLTSIDTNYLSLTVFEKITVKILNPEQNGGFWPF